MRRFWSFAALMIFYVMSSSTWASAPSGLLAEWNFDEGQGTILRDTSGNENHGMIQGGRRICLGIH